MRKKLGVMPAIFPMPVLMIATYNEDGSVDVMNAAWGAPYGYNLIKLNISEGHKTTQNINRTGCFTVSLADKPHMAEADYFGTVSAKNLKNKFERTGMHAIKSQYVDAPIIDEFPLCMECRAVELEGEPGVLGEIVNITIDEKFVKEDGSLDLTEMQTLAYDTFGHGYYEVTKKVGQAFNEGKRFI